MENYRGVLTFDDRGPIKTVAQLTAINSHNTRANLRGRSRFTSSEAVI